MRAGSRSPGTTPTTFGSSTQPPWRGSPAPRAWCRPSRRGTSCRADPPRGAAPGSARSGLRTARLLAAPSLAVRLLGDHDLAAKDADDRAVLLVADGLDVHDPAIVLGLG